MKNMNIKKFKHWNFTFCMNPTLQQTDASAFLSYGQISTDTPSPTGIKKKVSAGSIPTIFDQKFLMENLLAKLDRGKRI